MVLFENGEKGMILNLETSVVKIVLFGPEREVTQGSYVFRTQNIVSIRTGAFSRVIDGIGNPIDGPSFSLRKRTHQSN